MRYSDSGIVERRSTRSLDPKGMPSEIFSYLAGVMEFSFCCTIPEDDQAPKSKARDYFEELES